MSGLVEHVTRWENAQLEAIFNEDLKCEGEQHGTNLFGHDDGPARYRVGFPCGAPTVLACAGRAAVFLALGCTCAGGGGCGSIHEGVELRVVEL